MRGASLHHVQVLCPPAGEAEAVRFYSELLQLEQIDKPRTLSEDGAWFRFADGRELHIGARRAGDGPTRNRQHFALRVDSLDAVIDRLRAHGVAWKEPRPIPGWRRIQFHDPFSNLIEVLEILVEGA